MSITSRVATDDKSLFVGVADEEERKSWTTIGFKYNKCPCLNLKYLFRVIIWRFLEITNRIFLAILIWINMGGLSLSIILGFEFIFCLIQSIRSKNVGPMASIMYVATTVDQSDGDMSIILLLAFIIYRVVSNWIYLILLTIFSSLKFEAA
eukprot:249772_1